MVEIFFSMIGFEQSLFGRAEEFIFVIPYMPSNSYCDIPIFNTSSSKEAVVQIKISNFLVSFLNEFALYRQAKIQYYYYTVVIFAISDGRSHVGSDSLTQKLSAEWVCRLLCECLAFQDFLN